MLGKTLVIFDGMNHFCGFASFDVEEMVETAFKDAMDSIFYLDAGFGTPEARCRVVFVWDPFKRHGALSEKHDKGFRNEVHPAYKANRSQRKSVIVHAGDNRDAFCDKLNAAGIPSVTQPGLEADDYIAFIARMVCPDESIIISQDADFLHLVSPKTSILRSQGWLDHNNFEREIGLCPKRHLAWKALAGDPSDNIPAIRDSSRSWAWAAAGACRAALTQEELSAYERNLSLIKLALWGRKGAVPTATWRAAKRQFVKAVAL